MNAKNWTVLDERSKARSSYAWAFFLGLIFVVTLALAKNVYMIGGVGFWSLVIWYLASGRAQINYFAANVANGYEKRSWFLPVFVGIVALLFTSLVLSAARNALDQATPELTRSNSAEAAPTANDPLEQVRAEAKNPESAPNDRLSELQQKCSDSSVQDEDRNSSCGSANELRRLLTASTAPSQTEMISRFEELNDKCRGGSGSDSDTWVACGARDELTSYMRQQDICLNEHPDNSGKTWVTCKEADELDRAWNESLESQ